jgi:predicted dienelactone hydrolase
MLKILSSFISLGIMFMSIYAQAYNAGLKEINHKGTELAIWYPTVEKEEEVSYWAWKGKAAKNSKITQGNFPLLVFSHGWGGIKYNQFYLAEFMVRNGYIIVAIDHNDRSFSKALIDRPQQITQALDIVLTDLDFKSHIDSRKVGAVGHSFGGYTILALGGGVEALSDHRIKAATLFAPGPMQLFDQESLAKVNIPVMVIEAEHDEVIPSSNIQSLKNQLPKIQEYFILKGAGHYAFLPVSDTDYIKKLSPEITYDPDLSRKDLHLIIQKKVLSFFDGLFLNYR